MSLETSLIILIVTFVGVYLILPPAISEYLRSRGTRVVKCPETRKAAAVEVNAIRAALTAPFEQPKLRLSSCSRWPERKECGQECLLQVELSPEDCLVKNMLQSWYEARSCAFCGRYFGKIRWSDHKPALLSASGEMIQWGQIPPEKVPEMLATHEPVCWDCLVVETFLRLHPDLIVDRSQIAAAVHREVVR